MIEVLLLVFVMVATYYYLFRNEGFVICIRNIRKIGMQGFCISLALLLAYILLESVIIKIIMQSFNKKVAIGQCCKYSFIGFFFYCISPAGSAELPAQLYVMHRDGINVSISVLILALVTIMFKVSIILFGLSIYVFQPDRVMEMIVPVDPLCVLGLILSGAVVALLVCTLSIPENMKKGAVFSVKILNRIGIVKDTDKWNKKADIFFLNYSGAIKLCRGHTGMLCVILVITIMQRICFLAITAVSCHAIGVTGIGGAEITALQAMIQLATEMLPLPGGMGANEIIYMKTFTPAFGNGTLTTLIASRGISYYCQLVICGLATATITIYSKIKRRKGEREA